MSRGVPTLHRETGARANGSAGRWPSRCLSLRMERDKGQVRSTMGTQWLLALGSQEDLLSLQLPWHPVPPSGQARRCRHERRIRCRGPMRGSLMHVVGGARVDADGSGCDAGRSVQHLLLGSIPFFSHGPWLGQGVSPAGEGSCYDQAAHHDGGNLQGLVTRILGFSQVSSRALPILTATTCLLACLLAPASAPHAQRTYLPLPAPHLCEGDKSHQEIGSLQLQRIALVE